jgi:hypothetical protein
MTPSMLQYLSSIKSKFPKISYALWKNRNAFVFGNEQRQHGPLSLVALITEEYNLIKAAFTAPVRGDADAARE